MWGVVGPWWQLANLSKSHYPTRIMKCIMILSIVEKGMRSSRQQPTPRYLIQDRLNLLAHLVVNLPPLSLTHTLPIHSREQGMVLTQTHLLACPSHFYQNFHTSHPLKFFTIYPSNNLRTKENKRRYQFEDKNLLSVSCL